MSNIDEKLKIIKDLLRDTQYTDIKIREDNIYLDYDTGNSFGSKENWGIYCKISEDLQSLGLKLDDTCFENGHIYGNINFTDKIKGTLMFRGQQKTTMAEKHFGAGSVVIDGNAYYSVVGAANEQSVYLLNMQTMCLMSHSVSVEDVNFLSESEARNLIGGNLTCAFSDCSFDAPGLKLQWCLK